MDETDVAQRGRLFIPACGDRLRLTAPWRFTLFFEHRNTKFAVEQGVLEEPKGRVWNVYEGEPYRSPLRSAKVELPAGTLLECDRIYVRQYNKGRIQDSDDYDSITWKVLKPKGRKGDLKPAGRFWVKLPDCYAVQYELEWDSLYRDRVKLVDQVHGF